MQNGKEPAFAAMNEQEIFFGLTKREYFASMAMQAMLSNPSNNMNDVMGVNGGNSHGHIPLKEVIESSISYADELLKHLNK